jgi:hypothetical protein
MLFAERVAVYWENRKEHTGTVRTLVNIRQSLGPISFLRVPDMGGDIPPSPVQIFVCRMVVERLSLCDGGRLVVPKRLQQSPCLLDQEHHSRTKSGCKSVNAYSRKVGLRGRKFAG